MSRKRSSGTATPLQNRGSALSIASDDLQQLLSHWRRRHSNWSRHAHSSATPRETAANNAICSATLAAIEDLEDVMAGKSPRDRPING